MNRNDLAEARTGRTMRDVVGSLALAEEGQDLVEYAFLLVFIALILVAILTASGTSVNSVFNEVNTGLQSS